MVTKAPKDIITAVNTAGMNKAKMSLEKTLLMGFLAGAFIAFGGFLAIMVGGGIPGIKMTNPGLQKFVFGGTFPVGLMLVVIAGSELFTGNTAISVPGVLTGRIKWLAWMRNMFLSYTGNLIGSLFVAFFLAYQTDLLVSEPWLSFTIGISKLKVSQSFWVLFLKGIGCNWLVCLAIWLAVASEDVSGKILGIWFPIMAFVTLGFEHSVANMFFIPLGIFYGADVTWTQFFIVNLIPVTLGNIVGGSFFVGTIYWYVYEYEKPGNVVKKILPNKDF
ncbi:MAG: formate/nitrite transporter family protein [Deltaproteobacteria bacterium]|nr:formate/nitrite transporter family protein [Deltaproteobacteria bacterium]MBW2597458.1 formate/nitrite transporter family protein [Deltaproteobacteria bacterium]MBW2638833.1 formate/nitrite transporter family protein [Deltaproteobacteria bacterium]MBW2679901.1 formate/nitrite transporter family protein [Deltaproteobacteria bacterium]